MNSNLCFLKMHGSNAIRIGNLKEIAPTILQSIGNLSLWSYASLRNLHIGLQQMLIDLCENLREGKKGSEKANYTRMISKAGKVIHFTPTNRDILLGVLYDLVLESEGMGRLRGYGMGNKFGDSIRGNPEYNRMTIPKEA